MILVVDLCCDWLIELVFYEHSEVSEVAKGDLGERSELHSCLLVAQISRMP